MKRIRRNVLVCLCVVVCLGLAGQPQEDPNAGHMGHVIDWSYHHVVVSGSITNANLDRARGEPRILFHLAERNLASSTHSSGRSNTFEGHLGRSGFHPDPGRDGGHSWSSLRVSRQESQHPPEGLERSARSRKCGSEYVSG